MDSRRGLGVGLRLLDPLAARADQLARANHDPRDDRLEIGCIAEEGILSGDLAFPKENPRLEPGEEGIVLLVISFTARRELRPSGPIPGGTRGNA